VIATSVADKDIRHAQVLVAGETKPGTIYELGGPDVFTFKELMEFVLATRLQFRVAALAQTASGTIDVADDHVRHSVSFESSLMGVCPVPSGFRRVKGRGGLTG
jgi:hypothetical protein